MTLLESCVSIGIVSAVAFLAAPSLIQVREDYQLQAAARQVAGKMQWTRIKAISRSRDCRIRVDSPVSYVIECQDAGGWAKDETVVLPRGFRITATASPEFHVRGNVAPTATLTVWDAHSNTKRVVVNITGRVRIN
jgi:Tfp pilus assembly protein FimT